MATEWVDFKVIKNAVSITMVLDHYGISDLTKRGDELRGPCPIHQGNARSKNFSVNTSKNAFKCFSSDCKAKGNVLDFVEAMEGCNVREAALKLADWFEVGESQLQSTKQGDDTDQGPEIQRGIYRNAEGKFFELVINQARSEDLKPRVVYRELFGDYQFFVASPQDFDHNTPRENVPHFTLVKAL